MTNFELTLSGADQPNFVINWGDELKIKIKSGEIIRGQVVGAYLNFGKPVLRLWIYEGQETEIVIDEIIEFEWIED